MPCCSAVEDRLFAAHVVLLLRAACEAVRAVLRKSAVDCRADTMIVVVRGKTGSRRAGTYALDDGRAYLGVASDDGGRLLQCGFCDVAQWHMKGLSLLCEAR
jgi:hypothetical protein